MRDILLLLLSLAAGCVDALAFLHTGTFPANMTGNSVVLGLALARANVTGAELSALALLGFTLGAAAGARLTIASDRAWSVRVTLSLALAGALLLGAAAAIGFGGHFVVAMTTAAVAMGLQSAAVQRLGVAGVSTVVVTGTLTTAIMRLVARVNGAARPTEAGAGSWLPAASWGAYFAGAIVGGLQSILHTPLPILLPGVILLGVAAAAARARLGRA
jgi:uncharacterized membrane protein YoaK (UPF0700 family)